MISLIAGNTLSRHMVIFEPRTGLKMDLNVGEEINGYGMIYTEEGSVFMTEDVMFNSLVDVQKGWINIRAEAVVDQPIRDQDFRLLVARTFRLADGTLIEEGSGLEFGTRNNQVMQAIKAYALGNEEELEKYDYNNLGINLDAKRKGYGLLHSDEGSYIVSEEPFRQIANEDTARIHLRGEAVQLTVCHRVYKLLTTQDIEIGDQTIPAGTVFDAFYASGRQYQAQLPVNEYSDGFFKPDPHYL